MARVTVEDCVDKIPNRFELVLLASQRARAIAAGSPVTLERDNDKNPVVALREVAGETLTPEELTEAAIYNLRKHVEVDEPEEDDMSLLMAAQGQSGETGDAPAADYSASEQTESAPTEMDASAETSENETAPKEAAEAEAETGLEGMGSDFFSSGGDAVESSEGDETGPADGTKED